MSITNIKRSIRILIYEVLKMGASVDEIIEITQICKTDLDAEIKNLDKLLGTDLDDIYEEEDKK